MHSIEKCGAMKRLTQNSLLIFATRVSPFESVTLEKCSHFMDAYTSPLWVTKPG
jgi:hypothetical protein